MDSVSRTTIQIGPQDHGRRMSLEDFERGRDYQEKGEEYLAFGVHEYWIVDYAKRQMLVLQRRSGKWQERVVKEGEAYRPAELRGFEFNLGPVFEAADRA